MLKIEYTNKFKRDFKTIKKRDYDIKRLKAVVQLLSEEKPLPSKCHDHALTGNYIGFRECHIQPDWLLIYHVQKDRLILTLSRTGTHSDLF